MIKSLLHWSLRTQLLILAFISVLPAFVIIIYAHTALKEQVLKEANISVNGIMKGLAYQQQLAVENTRQLLMLLGRVPEIQQRRSPECNRLLADLLQKNPLYANLFALTPNGTLFSSSIPTESSNFAHRKYYIDLIKTHDYSAGEYVIGRTVQRPVFHLAYPVMGENNQIKAIVAAALDLRQYDRIFSQVNLPEGASLVITDHRNICLYRYPDFGSCLGREDTPIIVSQISANNNDGGFVNDDEDGVRRLYVYHKFRLRDGEKPYMHMRIGVPEADILADVKRQYTRDITSWVLALFIAMGMSWLLAHFLIVRRLDRMVAVSQRLRDGEHGTQTGLPHAENELGKLAEAIDQMSAELKMRDVESRKKEEMLSESEAKYRTLVESSLDLIFMTNLKGYLLYVNPRFEQILGFLPSELIGKPFTFIVAPESITEVKEHFRKGIAGEIVPIYEAHLLHKDGGRVAIEFHVSTLFDLNGMPVGRLGVGRDVTERKHTEEALRESEKKYFSLFNQANDAIFIMDGGCVVDCNRRAEVMFGCSRSEMIGEVPYGRFSPAFQPDGSSSTEAALARIAEFHGGAVQPFEWKHCKLDGTLFDAEVSLNVIEVKGKKYLQSIVRDISERKKVEARYQSMYNNAIDGIYQSTLAGHFLSVNPAMARIHGYDSPQDMMEEVTDITGQLYINAGDRKEFLRIQTEKGVVENFEVERLRRDGKKIWVSITSRAVKNDEGEIVYLEGTVKDITLQKILERQLVEAQKMDAIGKLAGGIAHDFNNILASIVGYTEMAIDESEEALRENYLVQVLRSSDRAKNLVRQILTFSRHREHEKKSVDMARIMRESLRMLRSTLPTTIDIQQTITNGPKTVYADPVQMQQVIINLCTNSAHAMGEKGGLLKVSLFNMTVSDENMEPQDDLKPGSYVVLEIMDTGHGIDQSIIDKIFDPFFTTKEVGLGTGLGLSVVYGIVTDHGGVIRLSSKPEKGTVFNIYLPYVEDPGVAEISDYGNIPEGTEHIFFIDDDADILVLGHRLLEALGYRVTTAEDGIKALAMFRAQPEVFDLVVTDMTMPGMTGTELAAAMMKIRPELPVILCTGYSSHIDEEKAKKMGIGAFMLKPIVKKYLAETIRELLDRRKDH